MRSMMMGAALVAGVTCGLAGGAEAATFSFDVQGDTIADGGYHIQATVDLSTKTVAFQYNEDEQTSFLGDQFEYWSFTGIAKITDYTVDLSHQPDIESFKLEAVTVSGSGTHMDVFGDVDDYYLPSLDLFYNQTLIDGYFYDTSLTGYPIPDHSNVDFASLTGDPFISTVPLPVSSPLFAIALITFATLGRFTLRFRP